ncbi:MAG: hypothetical protein HKN47_05960 [Pirellulaceae bacterium]|nr:hypothetical protein [Pirellulaceae bacterium]
MATFTFRHVSRHLPVMDSFTKLYFPAPLGRLSSKSVRRDQNVTPMDDVTNVEPKPINWETIGSGS